MLNPLFGKCTLIDPVLAAEAAAAAPLPLSAISVDFAGVSPGTLLPWLKHQVLYVYTL